MLVRKQAEELKIGVRYGAEELETAKEKTTAMEVKLKANEEKQLQRNNLIAAMQDWILRAEVRVRIQKW